MSYLVFARKYRPQTFAEVLGQEPIVQTLSNAITLKKIGQGYLFAGPRGTGKTSTARIFSKSLNCEKGPTLKPCLKCSTCVEIAEGRSLDVLEIDGASNRGIDQIRSLRELAKFAPSAGRYKIYIIDEVHQITPEGFNALLKTLEEPPAHVIFILATTAAYKVPATILSRCQRYDFKRLPVALITEKLQAVAKQEKLKLEEAAALAIARAGGGSLRDAESLLDQAAAYGGGKVTAKDLQTLLGTIHTEVFAQAAQALQKQEPVALLKLVAQASDAGTDLFQWVTGLLGFLRNLLVAKVGAGPLGFEELSQDEIESVRKLSEGFSPEGLAGMAQVLAQTVEMMRRSSEPRIPLEVALVRLSSGTPMESLTELVDRMERLAAGDGPAAPSAPARGAAPAARPASAASRPAPRQMNAAPSEPAEPAPAGETPPAEAAPGSPLANVRQVWAIFLSKMHERKASIFAYLNEAQPVRAEGADPLLLEIGFSKGFEFHRKALDSAPNRDLINEMMGELLDRRVECTLILSGAFSGGESPPAAPASSDGEAAPASDWVQSVADLFEGRVLPGEA